VSYRPGTSGGWSPPIDLQEREKDLILTAKLPGLHPNPPPLTPSLEEVTGAKLLLGRTGADPPRY